MKKKAIIFITIVATLLVCLCILTYNPIISCEIVLPNNHLEAIENQAKGVYSNVIPLVPVYVLVESFSDNRVYYTIHYFPFGTVGMSYTDGDGYNIEKPLTKL